MPVLHTHTGQLRHGKKGEQHRKELTEQTMNI